jgi:serine/threonine protein phosphatase PrpC
MTTRYAVKSDIGRVRQRDEDSFAVLEKERLFVVADGMGGHAAGEFASQMAVQRVTFFYEYTSEPNAPWPVPRPQELPPDEGRLVGAIRYANDHVFWAGAEDTRLHGMGTTIVAAQVLEEHAVIAHVGDSRAYLIRDGAIRQLTRDHSMLEDWKRLNPGLSAEEERAFAYKNVITRALGVGREVAIDVQRLALASGDVLLLCCDGLTTMVDEAGVLRIVEEHRPALERVVEALVDEANRAGGVDNITVLVVECTAESPRPAVARVDRAP